MAQKFDVDQFEPPPNPELICVICQNVLYKPLECPCRHVFCCVCIETWVGDRRNCPTCRERTQKDDLKQVMPMVKNLLNSLTLKCCNAHNGCEGLIKLEHYDNHIEMCPFEKLVCSFKGCGNSVLRQAMEAHKTECQYRLITCTRWCGLEILWKDLEQHDCRTAVQTRLAEEKAQHAELEEIATRLKAEKDELKKELERVKRKLNSFIYRYGTYTSDSSTDSDSDGDFYHMANNDMIPPIRSPDPSEDSVLDSDSSDAEEQSDNSDAEDYVLRLDPDPNTAQERAHDSSNNSSAQLRESLHTASPETGRGNSRPAIPDSPESPDPPLSSPDSPSSSDDVSDESDHQEADESIAIIQESAAASKSVLSPQTPASPVGPYSDDDGNDDEDDDYESVHEGTGNSDASTPASPWSSPARQQSSRTCSLTSESDEHSEEQGMSDDYSKSNYESHSEDDARHSNDFSDESAVDSDKSVNQEERRDTGSSYHSQNKPGNESGSRESNVSSDEGSSRSEETSSSATLYRLNTSKRHRTSRSSSSTDSDSDIQIVSSKRRKSKHNSSRSCSSEDTDSESSSTESSNTCDSSAESEERYRDEETTMSESEDTNDSEQDTSDFDHEEHSDQEQQGNQKVVAGRQDIAVNMALSHTRNHLLFESSENFVQGTFGSCKSVSDSQHFATSSGKNYCDSVAKVKACVQREDNFIDLCEEVMLLASDENRDKTPKEQPATGSSISQSSCQAVEGEKGATKNNRKRSNPQNQAAESEWGSNTKRPKIEPNPNNQSIQTSGPNEEDMAAEDESDDSSWRPPTHTPSDLTMSDADTDNPTTDYDVFVPKSAAQLLEEYQSCDSDDSWHG